MHRPETVSAVLALRDQGLGARRIARRTELPLGTVRDWLAGKLPRHSRGFGPGEVPESTCESCGGPPHAYAELPRTYVYLLGLYLGDGSISSFARGVYRLRITLDLKYPGIIKLAATAATEIRGRPAAVHRQGTDNCVNVSSYWKAWPCLFPQHGPGKKHERLIFLTNWQTELVDRWPKELLCGLIHSDGCRFTNRGRGGWVCPRYSFVQASDDIRAIFGLACDLVGVHWTKSGQRTIYVSRKADVAKLDEFIGPKH